MEEVPVDDFQLPLGKADVLVTGSDLTMIGWGTQVHVLKEVAAILLEKHGVSAEVIDLVSILPWDADTVCKVTSLKYTRCTENVDQKCLATRPNKFSFHFFQSL